jgi:hypothetical protein
MTGLRVTEVARIPWGGPAGLPELFVDEPTGGVWSGEALRKVHAPVPLRLAADGSFALLAGDPLVRSGLPAEVLRLTAAGVAGGRVRLEPPEGGLLQWQIRDFAVDREGCVYLLELATRQDGGTTLLRKIRPDGEEVWRRSSPWRLGPDRELPPGSASRLLTGGGTFVGLSAAPRHGLVARIDPRTGELSPYVDLAPWTGEALLGPDDKVYYVRLVTGRNARAWVRRDPDTGEEAAAVCAADAFDVLGQPIGVDVEGRAYGVDGAALGCVATSGALLWKEMLDVDGAAMRQAAGGERRLQLGAPSSWQVDGAGTVHVPVQGARGLHLLALSH